MSDFKSSQSRQVADQPAFAVAAVGFCVALALGFLVRGLLREDRLKSLVETEIRKIQGPRKIQVDRVLVSLARGIWPDLSLQIEGVHLESGLLCEMSPIIDINQIRLPISLWSLIQGRIALEKVEIDQALVLLRNDPKECGADRKTASTEPQATPVEEKKNSTQVSGKAPQNETLPPVLFPFREISLRKLRLNYLPIAFTTIEFDSVEADIDRQSPFSLQIEGQLNVGGETLSGDYSSRSFWSLKLNPEKDPSGEFSLDGSWREGRYRIDALFDQKTKFYDLKMNLEHLPLSQVFPVLKKYKIMESDFNGKKTWMSGEIASKGQWNHMTQSPWDLKNMKLEGDLGEIAVEQLHFAKLEPLDHGPVNVDLKKLDLEALLAFLNRPHPNPALGRLGVLEAKAIFRNSRSLEVSGVLRNLELIFSNKGSRQIQILQELSGALSFNADEWRGKIDRMRLQDGRIEGNLDLRADKNWKDLDLSLNVLKLQLSPKIENLITQGGFIKEVQGRLNARFENGSLRKLSGSMNFSDLNIEGIRAQKTAVLFEPKAQSFGFRVSSQKINLGEQSSAQDMISFFRESEPGFLKAESLENLSAQFETKSLDDFRWQKLRAKSATAKIESSGGWNSGGDLDGNLTWQDRGKTKKWIIKGRRGSPQFLRK